MPKAFLTLFCFLAALSAQTKPAVNDPESAAAGKALFRVYCAPCHGIKANGGRAPDLTLGTYHSGDKDSDLFQVINNGVVGTDMPNYAQLGDTSIWQLVAFIRSTTQRETAGLKGEPQNGAKLFWGKGGCGPCHTVGQRGGRIGPDLTRIGRQRSLAHLRTSIVEPDADVHPAYSTITIVTRQGNKITGVQRGFDNFSVALMDSSEKIHSYYKDELQSVQREFKSIMPATYGKLFTPAEIDDLLAYMSGLKGSEGSK